MASGKITWRAWAKNRRIGAALGPVEVDAHYHPGEWSLSVLFWTPFGANVALGPLSLFVGVRGWHFFGPGISYFPRDRYWAGYLSDSLWWESR